MAPSAAFSAQAALEQLRAVQSCKTESQDCKSRVRDSLGSSQSGTLSEPSSSRFFCLAEEEETTHRVGHKNRPQPRRPRLALQFGYNFW